MRGDRGACEREEEDEEDPAEVGAPSGRGHRDAG